MNLSGTKEFMQKLIEDKAIGGYAVTVCKNGEKSFISSDGVDRETYFDIASMGKVLITTPLILRAVGEGKMTLDDTLDMYFDSIPNDRRKITVRQLLTHTSGIVRCPISREVADRGSNAVAELIINNPLACEPGKNCIYSCNGMILLGYIAEKIHKMPFDKAYEEIIKKNLGLTRSKFNIAADEENAIDSYTRSEVGEYRSDDINVYNMRGIAGSGAEFYTMADIERYSEAVMAKSESLYAKELFDLAEQNHTGLLGEQSFGLGWFYADERYTQKGKLFPIGSFGHTGWTGTSFFFNREQNLYAIVLTNAARYSRLKHGCVHPEEIHRMRAEIHNAIYDDLNK